MGWEDFALFLSQRGFVGSEVKVNVCRLKGNFLKYEAQEFFVNLFHDETPFTFFPLVRRTPLEEGDKKEVDKKSDFWNSLTPSLTPVLICVLPEQVARNKNSRAFISTIHTGSYKN